MKVEDIVSGQHYYVLENATVFIRLIEKQLEKRDALTVAGEYTIEFYTQEGLDNLPSILYRKAFVWNETLCEKIGIFETKEALLAFIQKQLDHLP